MTTLLPKNLEQNLLQYVKETYLPKRFGKKYQAHQKSFNAKDLNFFLPAIADLSMQFTSERGKRAQNYFNLKEYRSAYLLYFFLTNFAKITHCLQQMYDMGELPSEGKFSVLDLGAGPGTASIACAIFFSQHLPKVKLDIVAFEQNKGIAQDASALFLQLAEKKHSFKIFSERALPTQIDRLLKRKPFQLIIAANMLNEFSSVQQQHELTRFLCEKYLAENASLLLLDPALQKSTRELMQLRDLLLNVSEDSRPQSANLKVLAPCLHQGPCPMLKWSKRDWCHFYVEWECPKLIRDIDHAIGNKHDYLKMAYMILKKQKREDVDIARGNISWRVVSSPMNSKGKAELLLCGENERLQRITHFDKDLAHRKVRHFNTAKRGDIISWHENKTQVDKNALPNILKKWSV